MNKCYMKWVMVFWACSIDKHGIGSWCYNNMSMSIYMLRIFVEHWRGNSMVKNIVIYIFKCIYIFNSYVNYFNN